MGAEVLLLFPVSALISSAALFAPCEQCGLADFAKGALQPWSLVLLFWEPLWVGFEGKPEGASQKKAT